MSGIDSLIEYLRSGRNLRLHALADAMASAIKFDLGEYDLPTAPVNMRREARPPYPATLLQFDTKAGRQIVLWQGEDSANGTVAGACRLPGESQWRVLLPRQCTDGALVPSDDAKADAVARHWASLAINVFAVIACSNVETRDVVPDAALQRRRAERGKAPLFTHKILVLKSGAASGPAQGGTHASPRVHLRRGHIRRLPSGNVWIQPCVVGDKRRGIVSKEYRVEPAATNLFPRMAGAAPCQRSEMAASESDQNGGLVVQAGPHYDAAVDERMRWRHD